MDTPAVSSRLIGAIFVEKGLITEEQLSEALEQQRASGERVGEILVSKFGVSRLALASALAEQWAEYERPRTGGSAPEIDKSDLAALSAEWPGTTPAVPEEMIARQPIGEIFRERGLLTEEQLEEALAAQAKSGQRLGEILVAKGVVSRLELASALADQWSTLQKLRPPASEREGQGEPGPAQDASGTSEPSPAASEAGTGEALAPLRADIDAIAARLERDDRADIDLAQIEERLAALERSHMDSGVLDELRGELVELRERIATLGPPPDGAAADFDLEPLRERLVALEQKTGETDDFERLRARIDGLAARIAAVPQFDDAELVTRLDAVEGRLQIAAASASALDDRVSSALAGATDGLHVEVDQLRSRMASIESSSGSIEELRTELSSLEQRIGESTQLRAELAALAERVDSIPTSFEARIEEIVARAAETTAARADLDSVTQQIEALVEAQSSAPTAASADLEEIRSAIAGLDERVAAAARVHAEVAGLADQLEALPGSLESRLEDFSERIAQTDTLPAKLGELQTQLEALATRTPESSVPGASDLEALRTSISLLEARLGDADAIGAEMRALSERVDSIPSTFESQVEALTARVEEVALGGNALARLEERVDELASELAGASQLRVGDVEQLRTTLEEVASGRREVEESLQRRIGELERKLEVSNRAEIDVHAELRPVVRDATEPVHAELRELRTRLDESSTLRGALDAMGERLQKLEQDGGAAEFEQRARGLEATIDAAAAALREEQEELRARIENGDRERGRIDEVERRLAEMDDRLAAAAELEQQLTGSLEALGEEATTRARQGDDELRSSLTGLIQESAEAAHAARIALTNRVDELAAEIAAAAELTGRVDALQGRLDAGEMRDPRVEELERRLEEGAEVEGRLRGMVAPLEEAADAIQADQAALRQALGQALNQLSSVDSVAGRLADLERRLAEGEELESRLRESLSGLVVESASSVQEEQATLRAEQTELRERMENLAAAAESASNDLSERVAQAERRLAESEGIEPRLQASLSGRVIQSVNELQGGQTELRDQQAELQARQIELSEQIDMLGEEARALRALSDRVAAAELRLQEGGEAEKRLGDSLSRLVRETRDELLAEHAALRAGQKETAARLDEIEVLRERADDADERLGGVEPLRARLAAVDERLAEAEKGLVGSDRLAELEDRIARLATSSSRDTDELRNRLEELRDSVGAELASAAARAVDETARQAAAALERHTAHHETLEAQIAEADVRDEFASFVQDTERRLDELSERITSGATEALQASRRVDEVAHRAGEAVEALKSELAATKDELASGVAETHETLSTTVGEIESRIDDGARRSAERSAVVEQALRRELAAQRQALEAQADDARAQAESIDALASAAEERDAASVDAREELQEELERLSSSFGWRIERVEEVLARNETDELRHVVEELAERLDAQSAVSQEQVRVTEKALRKGLASLGARLAESEEAYVDAGNALRRSIERLGLAIEQADDRIEQRESPPANSRYVEGFVAFAPTGDGYRLLEVAGPLPDVGGELTIPEADGLLRVTRIGESPLPLDVRPCAFLERNPAE